MVQGGWKYSDKWGLQSCPNISDAVRIFPFPCNKLRKVVYTLSKSGLKSYLFDPVVENRSWVKHLKARGLLIHKNDQSNGQVVNE